MIYAIIQARTGSTRLPDKVLMKFCDKPDLNHVYNRVKKSKLVNKIIVATTTSISDDRIYELCTYNEIDCFRGSEEDVLDRFYKCCLHFNIGLEDTIVRITADCPLIDPNVIDEVIDFYIEKELDYVSNTIEPTYPDGLDVEVFSFKSLKAAWEMADLLSDREHVTPYIVKNKEKFKTSNYASGVNLAHHRWTLDEKEDYEFINIIYENLYREDNIFNMHEILTFLNENPKLKQINNKHIRNEGYLKSIAEDSK